MNFKQYLKELHNIEVGQAFDAHEPTERASVSIKNPAIVTQINVMLQKELNGELGSPSEGVQKIRKVLHRYGFDMPAFYEIDEEGDEVVFDLKQFGQPHGPTIYGDMATGTEVEDKNPDAYLYVLYYLADEGYYEFYAEVTDDEGIDELLSDEDEELEEE